MGFYIDTAVERGIPLTPTQEKNENIMPFQQRRRSSLALVGPCVYSLDRLKECGLFSQSRVGKADSECCRQHESVREL